MSTALQCSSCNQLLPDGVPAGLCPSCVAALLADASLRHTSEKKSKWPRRFGEYELLEKLGIGGMGIVYKARQRKFDRVVALKMIRRNQFGGEHEIQRFHCEAEAVARLDHPHIVPLYEVGEQRGRHFFSMLFIESGSLMTHMPRLRQAQRKSAKIVATVARAIHYAHQHGILHRDLKPANILLDAEDQPYVSDFGLAKHVHDEASMTLTGAVVGTPSYMAPEQAAGKHGKSSPAADVYSLGAILYELLTGQPPFAGETAMATLRQLQEEEPQRPGSLDGRINRDLETICLKCLEKNPQRRYPTAEALAMDLERFLRDEPIDGRPIGQFARLVKWARQRPALAAAITTAAVLLLAVTIASMSAAIHFANARDVPPPPNDPPVVAFMDTSLPAGVYRKEEDKDIVDAGASNADVLYDLLSDPRITRYKERIPANWDGEMLIINWHPDLLVIHRSAFFHATNAGVQVGNRPELGWKRADDPDGSKEKKWQALYSAADDHLILFLGFVGTQSPQTKFLVYSRGTGGGWKEDKDRNNWIDRVEKRFPKLKGRITTMYIQDGPEGRTFTNPLNIDGIRRNVQDILHLEKKPR